MLHRSDFDQARQIEHAITAAGEPGRVIGHVADCWGVVLIRPRRGSLGTLAHVLGAVLGAPVHLARRGRQLLVRHDELRTKAGSRG